jgi:hypothetical protein
MLTERCTWSGKSSASVRRDAIASCAPITATMRSVSNAEERPSPNATDKVSQELSDELPFAGSAPVTRSNVEVSAGGEYKKCSKYSFYSDSDDTGRVESMTAPLRTDGDWQSRVRTEMSSTRLKWEWRTMKRAKAWQLSAKRTVHVILGGK